MHDRDAAVRGAEMLVRRVEDAVKHDDAVKHTDTASWRRETRKMVGQFRTAGGGRVRSGGEPVLVPQPAETVNSLDNVPTFELRHRQVGDRRFEMDAAVRSLLVVVG